MIHIIKEILFKDLDNDAEFRRIPLIPGTGSVSGSTIRTEHGLVRKTTIRGTITHPLPGMEGNLQLRIRYIDGTMETFGRSGLPVRIDLSREDQTRFTVEYSRPVTL